MMITFIHTNATDDVLNGQGITILTPILIIKFAKKD